MAAEPIHQAPDPVRLERELESGQWTPAGTRLARHVALALFATVVVVFVGARLASEVGNLRPVDWQIHPTWLALGIALHVGGVQLHGELWRRLLARLGAPLPPAQAYRIWGVSLLTRYVPTQVLMPITRVAMAHRLGVSRSRSVTSISYEFVLGLGVATAMSIGYILSLPELDGSPLRIAIVLAPAVILLVAHPRVVGAIADRVGSRFDAGHEHKALRKREVAGFSLAYAISFVLLGLGIYLVAAGIYPVGGLSFEVLSCYAVGFAASLLAFFAPAGLGAREGATAGVLATAMPLTVALAVVVISRLVAMAVELAIAGGWTAVVRRRTGARAR